MRIDPCLIISVIGLLVMIPLSFSLDHVPYEGSCEEPPILYLQEDLGPDFKLFTEFCQSAKHSITIFARALAPVGPSNKTWIDPLHDAVKRGINVEIITSQKYLRNFFPFAKFTFTDETLPKAITSFAIADEERFVFSSQLFGLYNRPESDYYIDFRKCKSIVRDASAIVNFYKDFTNEADLTLFPHYYCSGISYPNEHKALPGDSYSFGLSPPLFVSPGRKSTITVVREFFSEARDTTINLFTTSLFPDVNTTGDYIPELIMSDQIETAASLNNITIRILLSENQFSRATNTTRSLACIPNVIMGKTDATSVAPSFFIRDDVALFMPLSFEGAISLDITFLSLTLKNKAVSEKLSKHFQKLWENNSTKIVEC